MHARQRSSSNAGTRVQLQDYDESLLLDRSYVPLPENGFGDDVAASVDDPDFGTIKTTWAVLLYQLAVIGYLIFLVVPNSFPNEDDFFAFQATMHLLLLILAMCLESYLRLNHRWRQQLGYLRFYRNTRHLLSVPFYSVSCSIAASLLVELWPTVLHTLTPHLKLVIITCLELVVTLIFSFLYIVRVRRHNRTEVVPDAHMYLQSALYSNPDTSLRRQDAVVEQQGELIRYLQRRCDLLAREVLNLQAREDSHFLEEQQDNTAGHLEHLLATREQELRALLAAKESLNAQNRQTWSLLEERTHENSQLQLAKQQYTEENTRLRATLEEWSHRSAKLEQRLNQAKHRIHELSQGENSSTPNSTPRNNASPDGA